MFANLVWKRGTSSLSESGMEWMCDGVNAATRASPAPAGGGWEQLAAGLAQELELRRRGAG
jgi:hypothetical protein